MVAATLRPRHYQHMGFGLSQGALTVFATAGFVLLNGPLAIPGAHLGVALTDYPPISEATTVVPRLLTPLAWEGVRRKLAATHTALEPELFDKRQARFSVYVPAHRPPNGYAVLVFVSPSNEAELPAGWAPILDRSGVIFVSPSGAGNDQKVLERRVPLALAALALVTSNLMIDRHRIFVGGFSGGSRVALRLALAYPDQFRGAFLNAGSDPIGSRDVALPSSALLSTVQVQSRFAFATGARDEAAQALDGLSISSLKHWCVQNIVVRNDPDTGHDIARAQTLDWALRYLSAAETRSRSEDCATARLSDMHAALDKARMALTGGGSDQARRLILDLDARYGGLAAPFLVDLAERCACGILGEDRRGGN